MGLWSTLLSVLALFPLAASAAAQFHRPTDPVATPASVLVLRDDAAAIDINPAELGFLQGASLVYVHAQVDEEDGFIGQGDALSFATPLFFGLSMGATVQSIRPGTLAADSDDRATFGLGLSFAPWRRFSFGVSGRGFYSGSSSFDGLSSVDFGMAWHAADWLGLSLAGRDLFASREGFGTGDLPLYASMLFGWEIRPFGNNDLLLNFDVAVDTDSRVGGRVGLGVRIPGFGQLASVMELERLGRDHSDAFRVLAELSASYENVTLGGGVIAGSGFEDHPGGYGFLRFEQNMREGIRPRARMLDLELSGGGPRETLETLLALDAAAVDDQLGGVLLRPRDSGIGTAYAQELRMMIAALRGAGKRVICHLENASGAEYYACAAADAVVIDPAGSIRLLGVSADMLLFGDTLRRIGLRADFVRIGEYKSAPEQFSQAALSEPARTEIKRLLADVHARLVHDLASDLHLTSARISEIIDDGPQLAAQAVRDELVTAELDETTLKSEGAQLDGMPLVNALTSRAREDWFAGPKIGVVMIDGTIVDGENVDVPVLGIHMTGGRTASAAIDALAGDPLVRAMVVRVDSPGGAVLASDQIWRAIRRARARKPVVVSMGSVAASGGYYVASAANEIWADPSTLTGSIGIYYGKVDAAGLAKDLGVGVETFQLGKRAGADSLFRPFSPEERAALVERIRIYYRMFLARVATGRGRTVEQIDALGRGRVYSGDAALRLGLVDRLGGFASALARARQLGGVGPGGEVIVAPARPGGLVEYVLGGGAKAEGGAEPLAQILPEDLRAAFARVVALDRLGAATPLALLPFDVAY